MMKMTMDSEQLQLRLQGLELALTDLRPVWPKVHEVFIAMVKTHFATQGGRSGHPWPSLAPRYESWKEAHYPGKTILRRSDRLYLSLVDPQHAEHIAVFTPTWAEFGTRVPYGRFHQRGTKTRGHASGAGQRPRTQGGLPPRPPIPVPTREDGEAIVDILLTYALHAARATR